MATIARVCLGIASRDACIPLIQQQGQGSPGMQNEQQHAGASLLEQSTNEAGARLTRGQQEPAAQIRTSQGPWLHSLSPCASIHRWPQARGPKERGKRWNRPTGQRIALGPSQRWSL